MADFIGGLFALAVIIGIIAVLAFITIWLWGIHPVLGIIFAVLVFTR